jgi:hypothetical protein
LVPARRTTRRHSPQDHNLKSHSHLPIILTSGAPGTQSALRHATNNALTPAPLSRWSEVTRRRWSCASPSGPPTNQASPTSSSGKIINLYAALPHYPACCTKTRERRGKAAQPTQKINPVRYGLACSGNVSGQKVRKSVSESAARPKAILCSNVTDSTLEEQIPLKLILVSVVKFLPAPHSPAAARRQDLL